MIATPSLNRRRRGAIAVLTAILGIFLLGMLAFAVDTSWMVLTRSELQNAADSAVLAGAQQLYNSYTVGNIEGNNQTTIIAAAITNAQSSAQTYAGYNSAGGVASLTLLTSDISIGFTDSTGKFTTYTPGSTVYPNTITVTMRRDSSANQPLNLFFGPVLGTRNVSITATASATLYTGVINNFKVVTGTSTGLLPMTYDVNAWQNFLRTGQDPDGNTTLDANGNPEIQVYPSVKSPGNFGLLSLDDSHIGADTISGWIQNGASASDIQALRNANLIPLTSHPANTWDWQGDTGLKARNIMDVNNQTGKVFYMPLYQPKNSDPNNYQAGVGQGSNYYYDIVAFVPVRVMPTSNSNGQVIVEPTNMPDANALFSSGSVVRAGTDTSSLSYAATAMPPKLTQ